MRANTNLSILRLICTGLVLALAGCGLLSAGSNQIRQPREPFSGEKAYFHVRYLSVDIGSRPASTDKDKLAAEYIAKEFRAQKLDVQQAKFDFATYEEKRVELVVIRPPLGGIKANSLIFSAVGDLTAELVDARDGSPEDFSNIDVKGKIVLMKRGDITFGAKVANASNAGAIGAIIYNHTEGELRGNLGKPAAIPAVAISLEDGARLLSYLRQEAVTASLMVDADLATKTSQNVVGIRPNGEGKIVILSAHYDSVEAGPGANDNASGVGTVLELARVTATGSYPFELRFIAFGAEELGLIGSQRCVESLSSEERERVLAELNFDMVGVGDDLRFGGDPGLVGYAEDIARELGVEARELDKKYVTASDQASFMEAGIPALMVHWQDDPNYHTENDRVDFVSPDRLEIAGRIALGLLARLAKGEDAGSANAEVGNRTEKMVSAMPQRAATRY